MDRGCKNSGRIGGVSKVGGWILLGEHRGDLGHRVGEGSVWGWVRVGGLCPPPTPHALASTPERHHTRSAPSPEARGAPARRVDAPLRCGVPQGPHHLVGWCGGVVRRGGGVPWVQSRRASARLSRRRRQGRRSGASTVWCAGHACACGHHARIRLRDGRGCWWRVSTKSASPHRSPVCTDVDGEEAAGSHAWAAWSGSVLSSCSGLRRRRAACWRSGAKAAGVAVPRGATPGANLGGARCMPRGRGSHNDATMAS